MGTAITPMGGGGAASILKDFANTRLIASTNGATERDLYFGPGFYHIDNSSGQSNLPITKIDHIDSSSQYCHPCLIAHRNYNSSYHFSFIYANEGITIKTTDATGYYRYIYYTPCNLGIKYAGSQTIQAPSGDNERSFNVENDPTFVIYASYHPNYQMGATVFVDDDTTQVANIYYTITYPSTYDSRFAQGVCLTHNRVRFKTPNSNYAVYYGFHLYVPV